MPRLQLSPAAWLADGALALALVAASEDWRSPFYVLMLTALILPSTGQSFRRALGWGLAFALAYLGVAVYTELDANTLESTIRLETIATHLMVPLVVVLALAYAADVLERLRDERLRSERWRWRASASGSRGSCTTPPSSASTPPTSCSARCRGRSKARRRSSSATRSRSCAPPAPTWTRASPSCARRWRAAPSGACWSSGRKSSRPVSEAQITVRGTLGELPAHIAAHVYRIGAEALTNAVRHGGAEHVDVALARNGSTATIEVRDDGRGLPAIRRPGSNGLRSMRARADTIGATLSLGPGDGGRGTSVVLSLSTDPDGGSSNR